MVSVPGVASIYARGKRLWGRLKNADGEWISKPTDFNVGQEKAAQREIAEAQRILDAQRKANPDGPMTVSKFAETWLKEREKRGLRSVVDDKGRINNHVLPAIGKLRLDEVRPRHLRDLVRELRQGDLAPRTIRNTYGIAHAMFHDAEVDELIASNPCKLKRGELPGKTDKDPEWRNAATYTLTEVQTLITSDIVPAERRIQYAFKALAGLRHGEVAGLRWRHYDPAAEPLHRLLVATSYDTGRTKTEVTRRVPVHPALAGLVATWKADHWKDIYGRKPKPTDLIVPTRNMTTVNANDAGRAMKYDLDKLELRKEAGEHRDRGGHDLRAWFITTCQENGAHRDLLRVVTHTGKGDVVSGYTRATWAALCAEVAKLRVDVTSRGVS
jgi:integrase